MAHIHIDLDTPHILSRFYNGSDTSPNDEYCHILLKRISDFLSANQVKATFFVVTQDLQLKQYDALLKKLSLEGHEIASHTHTHPYVDSNYSPRLFEEEIRQSCREIKSHFGFTPVGFRSPSYFMNESIIDILIQEGFKYDCSVLNSPVTPLFKLMSALKGATAGFEKQGPIDTEKLLSRGFKEFPVPTFLGLPYYNNLNLYFPRPIRNGMASIGRGLSPYLFHLIEFADYEEDKKHLPRTVLKHPNIMIPLSQKLEFAKKVIENHKKHGPINLTRDSI